MNKIIKNHSNDFFKKTIAITGATGGIGTQLCRYFLQLGAFLILLDRNREKSLQLKKTLEEEFVDCHIENITVDLEDFESVCIACDELVEKSIDVFVHNAGAYSIPRHICKTGFDNVFQINFVSPYYIIKKLLPFLKKRTNSKVIVVGSIAHNYSKLNEADIDFSSCKKASKVYGNAKRFLMFSLYELFKNEQDVSLAVTHPGITFTNITAHYPKFVFALIKYPMKIIFMKPKHAALSVLQGLFWSTGYHEWIGPKYFNIWGVPTRHRLKTCSESESKKIGEKAEEIFKNLETFKNDADTI